MQVYKNHKQHMASQDPSKTDDHVNHRHQLALFQNSL